jgi:hypothetical protein
VTMYWTCCLSAFRSRSPRSSPASACTRPRADFAARTPAERPRSPGRP